MEESVTNTPEFKHNDPLLAVSPNYGVKRVVKNTHFLLGTSVGEIHINLTAIAIPTRYVSGYLYTGEAKDVASHAWVDVWLGFEIGWRSIDVTHTRPAARTYCQLAVGRDYLDAAPVRGVRQGGGENMQASVPVADSAGQQQQ